MSTPTNCPRCGARREVWTFECGTKMGMDSGKFYQSDLCKERVARQKAEAAHAETRKQMEVITGCFTTAKESHDKIVIKLTETRRKLEEAEKRWVCLLTWFGHMSDGSGCHVHSSECLKKMYQLQEPKEGGAS